MSNSESWDWPSRIDINPQVQSGQPVIRGTRVPVAVLIGHLAGGDSVDEICESYPVTKEDVRAALAYAAAGCRSNASMRFLVDENLPAEIASLLEAGGHDTLYVPATDLHHSPDQLLVERSRLENRVLVTKDVTLAMESGHRTPCVILVQVPDWYRKGEITEVFLNFTRHPRFLLAEGSLTVLSQRRVTARPLADA